MKLYEIAYWVAWYRIKFKNKLNKFRCALSGHCYHFCIHKKADKTYEKGYVCSRCFDPKIFVVRTVPAVGDNYTQDKPFVLTDLKTWNGKE